MLIFQLFLPFRAVPLLMIGIYYQHVRQLFQPQLILLAL